ncbi:aspartate--tRNA(Asn) ligase [Amycolatopsis sp. NBC_00345]|uniref:aspartate--tRNA(Asn) ligase n=1 Tax=Amycolatopsis sp. NBC_00345 TaxID=2975955 RepID=UPI002E275CA6
MMSRTLVADLREHAGATVKIAGWVHRRRELKSVTFVVVRDRSGTAQAVFPHSPPVTEETVVEVTGRVTVNAQAPGGVELTDAVLTTIAEPSARPPFDLYRPAVSAGLPSILDNAAVALRHPLLRRRFEVAAASVAGFRRTLDALGFTEVHTPKIVATATESGANVFELDYFGRPAYLAQSPQFFKQAMAGVFERVYEVGPVFRAEPHDTARHLAQYTSLDAEFGFIRDHRDVMAVLRDVVAGMAAAAAPLAEVPDVPAEIPAVDFRAAQGLLAEHTGEDPRGEPDLAPAHERWLSDWARREHGSEFLFVTGYPMAKRPFYTHPAPSTPDFSNSFDLLFRGLELVTGGQRLHRHADYLAVLGDQAAHHTDYLTAFAHGMPPHGGFAIGLERWTARLLGLANIREATLFPRDLHRLRP